MADEEAVQGAAMQAIAAIEKAETHEKEEAPEQTPKVTHCPCCNWDLENLVVHPAEADKKEYVRSLLAKRQFMKTYSLFDGEVSLTYKMLTTDESKLLSRALRTIQEQDIVARTSQSLKIKLLFYLAQYAEDVYEPPVAEAKDGDLTPDDFAYWEALYDDRFGELPENIPIIMTRIFMEFHRLAEMLPSEGLDENFWKGAGLA